MAGQRPEEKQGAAVYVVEFDPDTRTDITVALAGLPWPVFSFATSRALLDSLQQPRSGCVVADVKQVDMSIDRLLEALRQADHHMPLILLSHDIEIPDAVAAMRAGVRDVLPLPVMQRALRRQVRSIMQDTGHHTNI